jgi:hypothetical protein
MDKYALAQALFGGGGQAAQESGSTVTLYGTATSDSSGGKVGVTLNGVTYAAEGASAAISMDTTTDVKSGDGVIVTVVDGHPVVTGVVGSGDRLRENVDAAADVAASATKAVTQAQSDIDEFKKTAEATYSTKTETDEKTNAVKQSIEANYVSKDDADTTYATKTELAKSADSIKSEVSEEYVTKKDASETYVGKSTFEQDSRKIATTVTSELTTGWTAWADDSTGKNMVLGDTYPSSATDPGDASHPLDVDGMAFRGSAKVLSESQPTDAKSYDWVPNPTATMRSEVRQTADAITSTVAAGYATKGDVSEVSTRVTQTASKVDAAITDVNGLSTLIREDSSGITVGKSTDGTTYSSGRTHMGTDGYKIINASGEVVATFTGSLISLLAGYLSIAAGRSKGGVIYPSDGGAVAISSSNDMLASDTVSYITVTDSSVWLRSQGTGGTKHSYVVVNSEYVGARTPDMTSTALLKPVHSLYNPNNGQHMYTGSASEISSRTSSGWTDEGAKFYAYLEPGQR